jgi:hypothetical protein
VKKVELKTEAIWEYHHNEPLKTRGLDWEVFLFGSVVVVFCCFLVFLFGLRGLDWEVFLFESVVVVFQRK